MSLFKKINLQMDLIHRILFIILFCLGIGTVQPLGVGSKALLCGGISGVGAAAWWVLGNKEAAAKEEVEKMEALGKDGLNPEELEEFKQKVLDLGWYRWGKRGALLTAILSGIFGIKYGVDFFLGPVSKNNREWRLWSVRGKEFDVALDVFWEGEKVYWDRKAAEIEWGDGTDNIKCEDKIAKETFFMLKIDNKEKRKKKVLKVFSKEEGEKIVEALNVEGGEIIKRLMEVLKIYLKWGDN